MCITIQLNTYFSNQQSFLFIILDGDERIRQFGISRSPILESTLDSSRNSNTEDLSELREESNRNDSLLDDLRLIRKAILNSGKNGYFRKKPPKFETRIRNFKFLLESNVDSKIGDLILSPPSRMKHRINCQLQKFEMREYINIWCSHF